MLDKLRAQMVRRGPSLLRLPIKLTPFALQRQVLEQVLGWQFRAALADGDLTFLAGRWLRIEVSDLGLQWYMTVENDRLKVSQHATADVSFCGNANDLILIAARREDPDTLFFQRRLRIEGDTELGLYVKNLMDSIDLDTMPTLLRTALLQMAGFIDAGLKEGADETGIRVSQPC
ncbi:SCP2 domain-containing protein [Acerihabitans sp. TG2]|uniref:ubiquinone anaerobic biosynthesis accessory factor UbiT n=1 Tax=Acerihabitans sp. TG2 TaxID=3096008 RepID=UPI002B223C26|nr:SCP2 domain-containing protein [Acerihabitans sp. TG2]MEA9392920.1 SCP2 domain-containing protein [Acerihabitans sp. TG2]